MIIFAIKCFTIYLFAISGPCKGLMSLPILLKIQKFLSEFWLKLGLTKEMLADIKIHLNFSSKSDFMFFFLHLGKS